MATFTGTSGPDTLIGTPNGSNTDDTLSGLGGDDTLIGGDGADSLDGGTGTDFASYSDSGTGVVASLLNPGNNTGFAAGDTYTSIEGLSGSNFDDTLIGDGGNNLLDGSGGADSLVGGLGDDIYILDNAGDVITENPGEGIDTAIVIGNFDYTLAANVDDLLFTTSANVSGTGNELANFITGGAGDNTLDGGIGVDTMAGGLGDDTYFVDDVADLVIENSGEGTDTVHSTVSYTLEQNVENLILEGSGNLAGTGNELANVITGGTGNDTLDGGIGADTMAGGLGADIYVVDNAGDVITENPGEGIDTAIVIGNFNYTLAENVDDLVFTTSANVSGTGNELANFITGGAGDNALDGGIGADTMLGGLGNDTYYVDNAGDVVTENPGEGTDTVHSTIDYTLTANVENLILDGTGNLAGTGNALANVITGNTGNNTLDGGIGADTMAGGLGNDTYFVDDAGDVVTENSGEGTDTVHSTIDYTLGANVENLILDGTGNLAGTGNALANVITGNTGNNTLDGGIGADTMAGGLGNDTYFVDNAGDVVTENSGEGTDTVHSTIDYTLTANVENLILDGSGNLAGTGNALANVITGNSGNNTLDGGIGADTMAGGLGNDTYFVDNAGDVVTENSGEGTDTVHSTIDYTLTANVENLILDGSGNLAGTGNGLANVITGNSGNNTLDGGIGADTMAGGLGNDTYFVDNAGDVVTENSGEGTDTVHSTINYTLGANVENLILDGTGNLAGTGNALANVITGNTGNNTLDGGIGTDTMAGGLGNDTYFVDNAGDVVTENSGEGTDTVHTTITYALTANVENLILDGSGNLAGTGNGLANVITGNSGNNTLDGGIGADTMAGGLGNDTYFVDNAGDVVTENSGEGTDTVHTTITYALTANVENLILDGSGNLTGSGNALNNVLTGNAGNNSLYGNDGNDTAYGGAGADILVLGNGDDYGDAGDGNDYIYAGAGNDVLIGGAGLDVLLGEDGNDVEYGGSGFNYLFGGAGTDTLIGSGGTAASDVNVMYGEAGADYLYGGQGTNYFYGGTGVDTMFGGSGLNIFISSGETDGNVIYGGSGQNYVYGSNGGDTVTGGSGVDVFLMGTGADNITGGGGVDYAWGGAGADTFNISDSSQEIMVIQDFNTGGVNDFVRFAGTSLHSFADVQAHETYVAGINTTIITDAAGSAVWLIGVAPGQLDASMFKFS
ncbi:rhizobiocin [Bradyrhizobium septentrionale]|uniref:Calcium-binding protein n=1 Tax=Bradyrhizobium septentrionale TaxID=1404411 RepID=A0A973W1W1_9BRAD|nr:hypothetical protein [Bradyrhizobium septentrionale]UGY14416.1 rhizobiocin [Bradyrhizobium septentrionale]UGY22868.1 rhizobiocin [Bradyrhizobium septentrionale]